MELAEVKEKLENFQLVQCGLSHEKVRLNPETSLPIKVKISEEEIFQRRDLCPADQRKKTLGCAHSSSNIAFERLIEDIASKDDTISLLKQRLNFQISEIYQLDHKKGDLEKARAKLMTRDLLCSERALIRNDQEIKQCIALHRSQIKNLGAIKSAIIDRIDELSY